MILRCQPYSQATKDVTGDISAVQRSAMRFRELVNLLNGSNLQKLGYAFYVHVSYRVKQEITVVLYKVSFKRGHTAES